MANIEHNLRSLAKAKGLKLSDIATRMGTTVSNLLVSVKGNPTVTKLEAIAKAIGVSVSELLTTIPDSAQGIAIINGQTYQLSLPAPAIVQMPVFVRYDTLRKKISDFIKTAVKEPAITTVMGYFETTEVFSLLYDPESSKFFLSLCFADGQTKADSYDKLEYADWDNPISANDPAWNLADVTEDIIGDIEGLVPEQM